MKETIVYLPAPASAEVEFGDCYDARIFYAQDVYAALDAAGVRWVQETPEEYKIRMMSLQIEELKRAYLELQDQNAALKMTIRRLEDKP